MRLVLIGIILLTGLCEIISCVSRQNAVVTPGPSIANLRRPFEDCLNCERDTFYGLTIEEFCDGLKKYKSDRQAIVKKEYGITDALNCWYSLDTLKKFICLIEKYSRDLHVDPSQLGIRFHYAVYPEKVKIMYGVNYGRLHTLFMTPTCTNFHGKNIDFDPRVRDFHLIAPVPTDSVAYRYALTRLPQGSHPLILDSYSGNNGDPARFQALTAPGGQGMDKNQGQLCPPTCPDQP